MSDVRRRDFITLLGGAAVAWPLAAKAQKAERTRRIGAFLQGLQQSGWSIGRNARIDTRWATANARHSQTRGGIGRARAGRHPGPCRLGRWTVAAGDPYRADRVSG